jgi:endonuclease/exonuclease/phosphatase family metal-dependent hydrolase
MDAFRRGSARDVELLVAKDRGIVSQEFEEQRGNVVKTWTALGLALERGEEGHSVSRVLLRCGANPRAVCARSKKTDFKSLRKPTACPPNLPPALFAQFQSEVASGAHVPVFSADSVLEPFEKMFHAQWECQYGPPEEYELNAVACALNFGFSTDLLADLLRANASLDETFLLNGQRWSAWELAREYDSRASDSDYKFEDALKEALELARCPVPSIFVAEAQLGSLKKQKFGNELKLSIVTWNIKNFGFKFANRDYNVIFEQIRKFDIVCIQETKFNPGQKDVHTVEGGLVVQWMKEFGEYVVVTDVQTFHEGLKNGGEYPLIFFKRSLFEINQWSFIPYNGNPQVCAPFCRNPFEVVLKHLKSEREFRVISYHGDISKKVRIDEMEQFGKFVGESQTPVLLCADLNFASAREHDETIKRFTSHSSLDFGSANAECKSTNSEASVKRFPFDHIWFTPPFRLETLEIGYGYGKMPISDHRYVAAHFTFQ